MQSLEEVDCKRVVINSITCDRCGATGTPTFGGFEGWHSWSDTGGYASPFGDMTLWELDLCESCFYELVNEFVRYPYEPELGGSLAEEALEAKEKQV